MKNCQENVHITGLFVPDKYKFGKWRQLATNRLGKCGVERNTSQRVDKKFVNFCKQNKKMSNLQITNVLKTHDLVVSERTVRKRLCKQGFKCHRPSIQSLLITAMKQK